MKNLLLFALTTIVFFGCQPKEEEKSESTEVLPVEFADPKYTEMAKQSLRQLAEGDMTGFATGLADNAVFRWNNGDSLVSKQAIANYWQDRRTNAIDTIEYSNEAWLAIKANNPPKHIAKGVYVFSWAQFHVTYNTGASIDQNIHNVYQFDDQGKISGMIQYLDRAPIAAAQAPAKK